MDMFQSRGRFLVGVSFDIPGMGYRNPQTGDIDGFEADISRAIAGEFLGSRDCIEFIQVIDERRIPMLQENIVDIVVSQLTITPDRARKVDFSIPYYITREALLVPKQSDIKNFEDIKNKRVAVTAGSVSLRRMRAAIPDATLVVTPLSADGVEAVAAGEADAASNDMINLCMLKKYSSQPDRYAIIDIGDRFDKKPFGVAVKKGNRPLVDLLNRAIEKLKVNGEIDRILDANMAPASAMAERA